MQLWWQFFTLILASCAVAWCGQSHQFGQQLSRLSSSCTSVTTRDFHAGFAHQWHQSARAQITTLDPLATGKSGYHIKVNPNLGDFGCAKTCQNHDLRWTLRTLMKTYGHPFRWKIHRKSIEFEASTTLLAQDLQGVQEDERPDEKLVRWVLEVKTPRHCLWNIYIYNNLLWVDDIWWH